jgi:hypothetical protein
MKITPTKTRNRLPKIALIVVLFLALIGGYTAYAHYNSLWPFNHTNGNTDQLNANDPTYTSEKNNEPTTSNADGSSDKDPTKENEESTPSKSDATKTSVEVGISSAAVYDNNLEIRGFISKAIEGDGTCTATVTNGTATVVESSKAFVDATTSQCEPILIPTSRFSPSGTWSVTITYSSPTHEGTSNPIEVAL